jgi:hypothetical protein
MKVGTKILLKPKAQSLKPKTFFKAVKGKGLKLKA